MPASDKPVDFAAWNTTRVGSWDELMSVLHDSTMLPRWPNQGGHRRSSYVFRGMSRADWPLKTSLERLGSPPRQVEHPLLRSFAKYAPVGTVSLKSEWDRLALAQHHGLPTRVLDWTASPLVAAHFATEEDQYRKADKEPGDGVIWCVSIDQVRDLHPLRFDDPAKQELCRSLSYVYTVPLLDALFPTLDAFDQHDPAADQLIFFEPPSIDARIQNQFGLLSVMNGASRSHDAYLRHQARVRPNLVRHIVIAKEAKPEIRDLLDQNNITERMLFPGLPGLCDWLRRYFGPA